MGDLQCAGVGYLSHDTFYEGRLSFTVLAYEGHLLTPPDRHVHMIEDGLLRIVFPHVLTYHGEIARAEAGREFQVHHLVVHLIHLDGYDFLQLLDAALHLYGLGGLIAEPLYECLDVGDLFLLVLVGAELLLMTLFAQHEVLVVFHLVVLYMVGGDL